MKTTLKIIYLQCTMLFLSAVGHSQMVSSGEITIMPNTEMGIISNFVNTNTGGFFNDGDVYIYGSFQNNGIVSYLNEGLVRFVGNTTQVISGTQESLFHNTLFSNTSSLEPFELSGSLAIENSADFTSGIVNNRNFGGGFTFRDFSNHLNTSNSSHVNGEVIKIGDTAFEFPIGNGGFFRPSTIGVPTNITNNFSSTYFLQTSDTSITPHDLKSVIIDYIDDTEYWEIERISGSSDASIITLGWDSNTTPDIITNATDQDLIHIVRWDDAEGLWLDEGGTVDPENNTVTTVTLPRNGIYTLAIVRSELPDDDLVIYNALTPNGDGRNDFFFIDGIERYPNNSVQVFNRLGVSVFKTTGYNESNKVFRGISDGRNTIGKPDLLPPGTYYYIVEYGLTNNGASTSQRRRKTGFLYIGTNK